MKQAILILLVALNAIATKANNFNEIHLLKDSTDQIIILDSTYSPNQIIKKISI